MLRGAELDAVALFTDAPDHTRHTLLCMERGKHVFCACPACLTLDEAAALVEAKQRTGMTYMTAETSYYRWPAITARRLYRDNALGEIVYSEAEYYHFPKEGEREAVCYRDGAPHLALRLPADALRHAQHGPSGWHYRRTAYQGVVPRLGRRQTLSRTRGQRLRQPLHGFDGPVPHGPRPRLPLQCRLGRTRPGRARPMARHRRRLLHARLGRPAPTCC